MDAPSHGDDPYEVVLRDLRTQRDKINAAIAAIEAVRGVSRPHIAAPAILSEAVPLPVRHGGGPREEPEPKLAEGPIGPSTLPFVGLTIPVAAIEALRSKRQAMSNKEMVERLMAGGLPINSADQTNTVNSVLARRERQHGDIIRVSRGVWGLPEWYPGRRTILGSVPVVDPQDAIDPPDHDLGL